MDLQLDEKYRVSTDQYNFTLEKLEQVKNRKTKETSQKWITKGHFSHLEHLLVKYMQEIVKDTDTTDVHNLIKEIRSLREHVSEVAKNIDAEVFKVKNNKNKES